MNEESAKCNTFYKPTSAIGNANKYNVLIQVLIINKILPPIIFSFSYVSYIAVTV